MEIENGISVEISEEQVPEIIKAQFMGLDEYRQRVDASVQRAQSAEEAAKVVADQKVGFFNKGNIIESLQEVTVDIAETQVSFSEAQQVSFEYQKKVAETMKMLLGLGVSNLAMNRSVVRELELILKNASEEELDELVYQEIINVVKQLKAQEDILKKQVDLTDRVKQHDNALKEQKKKNQDFEQRLTSTSKVQKAQNAIIKEQAKKGKTHDRLLAEKEKKHNAQDAQIAEGKKKDIQQDQQLALQAANTAQLL